MGGIPDIFTKTPIEAYIMALAMKIQVAVAAFVNGTPVFRALLFGVLAYHIVLGFLRMASHKHHGPREFVQILYYVFMLFLGMALLQMHVPKVTYRSSSGIEWATMTGVQADTKYGPVLSQGSETMAWYLWMYKPMDQIAQSITTVVSNGLYGQNMPSDPMFLTRMLAKMSMSSLDGDSARYFDALESQCANTTDGRIVGPYANMQDMFDMAKEIDPVTHSTCQDLWNKFDAAVQARKNDLVQKYPPSIWTKIRGTLNWMFPNIVSPGGAAENAVIANSIARYQREKSFANRGAYVAGVGNNQQFADGATMSNGWLDQNAQSIAGEGFWGSGLMDILDDVTGGQARPYMQKTEAAVRFNSIAALIPATRGFINAILAILFVFAAYSVGLGTFRFLIAWAYAQASLILYSPMAALGYKIAVYFTTSAETADRLGQSLGQSYILAAASMLNDQVYRIQTVYLYVELGLFAVFCVGALTIFRGVTTATQQVGAAVMTQVVQAAQTVMGVASPSPAGPTTTVNVNQGPSGGAAAAAGAGGGTPPSTGGAPLVVYPAATTGGAWGNGAQGPSKA